MENAPFRTKAQFLVETFTQEILTVALKETEFESPHESDQYSIFV